MKPNGEERFSLGRELILDKKGDFHDPAFDEANRVFAAEQFARNVQVSQPFRALLDKAEAQAKAALWKLCDVDPTDWKAVAELQVEIRACRKIGQMVIAEIKVATRKHRRSPELA